MSDANLRVQIDSEVLAAQSVAVSINLIWYVTYADWRLADVTERWIVGFFLANLAMAMLLKIATRLFPESRATWESTCVAAFWFVGVYACLETSRHKWTKKPWRRYAIHLIHKYVTILLMTRAMCAAQWLSELTEDPIISQRLEERPDIRQELTTGDPQTPAIFHDDCATIRMPRTPSVTIDTGSAIRPLSKRSSSKLSLKLDTLSTSKYDASASTANDVVDKLHSSTDIIVEPITEEVDNNVSTTLADDTKYTAMIKIPSRKKVKKMHSKHGERRRHAKNMDVYRVITPKDVVHATTSTSRHVHPTELSESSKQMTTSANVYTRSTKRFDLTKVVLPSDDDKQIALSSKPADVYLPVSLDYSVSSSGNMSPAIYEQSTSVNVISEDAFSITPTSADSDLSTLIRTRDNKKFHGESVSPVITGMSTDNVLSDVPVGNSGENKPVIRMGQAIERSRHLTSKDFEDLNVDRYIIDTSNGQVKSVGDIVQMISLDDASEELSNAINSSAAKKISASNIMDDISNSDIAVELLDASAAAIAESVKEMLKIELNGASTTKSDGDTSVYKHAPIDDVVTGTSGIVRASPSYIVNDISTKEFASELVGSNGSVTKEVLSTTVNNEGSRQILKGGMRDSTGIVKSLLDKDTLVDKASMSYDSDIMKDLSNTQAANMLLNGINDTSEQDVFANNINKEESTSNIIKDIFKGITEDSPEDMSTSNIIDALSKSDIANELLAASAGTVVDSMQDMLKSGLKNAFLKNAAGNLHRRSFDANVPTANSTQERISASSVIKGVSQSGIAHELISGIDQGSANKFMENISATNIINKIADSNVAKEFVGAAIKYDGLQHALKSGMSDLRAKAGAETARIKDVSFDMNLTNKASTSVTNDAAAYSDRISHVRRSGKSDKSATLKKGRAKKRP